MHRPIRPDRSKERSCFLKSKNKNWEKNVIIVLSRITDLKEDSKNRCLDYKYNPKNIKQDESISPKYKSANSIDRKRNHQTKGFSLCFGQKM